VDFYARAMQRANEAILARMNQPFAHLTKAYLLMFKTKSGDVAQTVGRYEEVLSDMDRAMRIGPHAFNYPQFWMRLRGTSGDENLNRKNPL
jgi:hypothetical protein